MNPEPLIHPVTAPASPGLIVFGRDDRSRPHASRFAADEAKAAERAAVLMGMHVLAVSNDEHRTLADGLPLGRVFESGRAFVPFVKADLFDRLMAAAGLPNPPQPIRAAAKPAGSPPTSKGDQGSSDKPEGAGGPHKPPCDWADIGIGSLVLATTGGPQEGWFEAVVMYTKADDHFELRWRDFPLHANISRHRSDLALLHPGNVRPVSEA
jgi:hypothetical protein